VRIWRRLWLLLVGTYLACGGGRRERQLRAFERQSAWGLVHMHVRMWNPQRYPDGCPDAACQICNQWRAAQ
jgi:hypothetical protein